MKNFFVLFCLVLFQIYPSILYSYEIEIESNEQLGKVFSDEEGRIIVLVKKLGVKKKPKLYEFYNKKAKLIPLPNEVDFNLDEIVDVSYEINSYKLVGVYGQSEIKILNWDVNGKTKIKKIDIGGLFLGSFGNTKASSSGNIYFYGDSTGKDLLILKLNINNYSTQKIRIKKESGIVIVDILEKNDGVSILTHNLNKGNLNGHNSQVINKDIAGNNISKIDIPFRAASLRLVDDNLYLLESSSSIDQNSFFRSHGDCIHQLTGDNLRKSYCTDSIIFDFYDRDGLLVGEYDLKKKNKINKVFFNQVKNQDVIERKIDSDVESFASKYLIHMVKGGDKDNYFIWQAYSMEKVTGGFKIGTKVHISLIE